MKSWVDGLTPPTESSIRMAKELDYDVPEAFDLAGDMDEAVEKHEPAAAVRVQQGVSRFSSFKSWVLRSIALFTSMSCAITSVYFSNIWFRDSQPGIIAIVMSLSVVLTLTVAPEFAISLARKGKWITAVAIVLISMVATAFSMSSTIGGIYNARSAAISRDGMERAGLVQDDSRAAAAEVDLLKAKIIRLSRSMETDQGAVSSYQANIDRALSDGKDPGGKEMQLLVANRNAAVTRVRAGEQSIGDAERRIAGLLEKSVGLDAGMDKVVRLDFSAWLGARLGLTADQMEFVLAAFPAVFIDLIAPAMLVVAFTL